jgi:hypothetical protein
VARRRYTQWKDRRDQALAMVPGRAPPQDLYQAVAFGHLRARRGLAIPIAAAAAGAGAEPELVDPLQQQQQQQQQQPVQQQRRYGVGAVVSTRSAYYNPLDGQHYCRRGYRNEGTTGRSYQDEEDDDNDGEDSDSDDSDDDNIDTVPGDNPMPWLRANQRRLEAVLDDDAQQKKKKKSSSSNGPDIASRLIGRARLCKEPLWAVDMPGTAKLLHSHTDVLCCYCGVQTELSNMHVTNGGGLYSCGQHPLAGEYGRHALLWRTLDTPAELVERVAAHASGLDEHTSVARRLGPCSLACSGPAVVQLWAYDYRLQLFRVALCGMHRALLSRLLPLQDAQLRLASPPPVRIDTLLAYARV